MYIRNKRHQTDFFKPLNKKELDRLEELETRANWLENKARSREFLHPNTLSSNLYRKELSATRWAIDYIKAHNQQILDKLVYER